MSSPFRSQGLLLGNRDTPVYQYLGLAGQISQQYLVQGGDDRVPEAYSLFLQIMVQMARLQKILFYS